MDEAAWLRAAHLMGIVSRGGRESMRVLGGVRGSTASSTTYAPIAPCGTDVALGREPSSQTMRRGTAESVGHRQQVAAAIVGRRRHAAGRVGDAADTMGRVVLETGSRSAAVARLDLAADRVDHAKQR